MIRHAILAIVANSFVMFIFSKALPQYIEISGDYKAFIMAGFFLGILNAIVKPLLRIFALPLIFLTGGLFSLLINALVLYLLEFVTNLVKISDVLFEVKGGFMAYLISSLALAVMNEIAHWLIKR